MNASQELAASDHMSICEGLIIEITDLPVPEVVQEVSDKIKNQ